MLKRNVLYEVDYGPIRQVNYHAQHLVINANVVIIRIILKENVEAKGLQLTKLMIILV